MAAGKKGKKSRKAEKKARKAEKKAAKRAARLARRGAAVPAPAAGPKTRAAKTPARKRAAVRRPAATAARKKAPRPRARVAVARKPPAPRPALTVRHVPESLRLRGASPSFTVNDIHRSVAFYRDALGFTVKERWEEAGELRGVELVAGGVSFWLSQDDWKKGRDRVKGQGFRLYCTTAQDIDALAERVRSAVTLLEEPKDQPWGGRDFAVVDPDGFVVSIGTEG
jgi:uncharacterized glyoxalase superfamily protein PhnB